MALVDEVDAVNRPIVKKLYYKMWPRMSAYVTKLMQNAEAKGQKTLGGTTIEIPFEYTASDVNFSSYVGAGKFTSDSADTITKMTDSWVHIQDNINMPEMDILENEGEGQVVDRWMRRQEQLLTKTQVNIAKLIWGVLTVKGLTGGDIGLNTIDKVYSTGTTLHGVAPADLTGFYDFDAAVSLWDPQVDAVSEEATEALITAFITDLADGMPNKEPNAGFCGKALFSFLRNMFRGRQRFVDTKMLKAGFGEQFSIDTTPIFLDRYCPGSASGVVAADRHLVFTNSGLKVSLMKNDDFIEVLHKPVMETRARVKQLFYSLQVWCEGDMRFHLGRFTKFNTAA